MQEIKAYINPNPRTEPVNLINPWGVVLSVKNEPFLEIEMINFPKGLYNIHVDYPVKMKKNVKVESSFERVYFVNEKFADSALSLSKICVKKGKITKYYQLSLKTHRISGQIKDFSGKIRPGYLWATKKDYGDYKIENEIFVKSDENGRFSLFYPDNKPLRIFVADEFYGNKSLECWLMGEKIKNDFIFNPRIRGKLELYELKAWVILNIWNIFFIPASIDKPFYPKLKKEEIKVCIDGRVQEINVFTPHKVFVEGKSKNAFLPAYILSGALKLKLNNEHIFNVKISSKKLGKGEAQFIFYRN